MSEEVGQEADVAKAAGMSVCGIAQVVPLLRVHRLGDRRFDYLIPDELADRIGVGSVVGIPFGSRAARGVVVSLTTRPSEDTAALRLLESVEDLAVPDGLVSLAERLAGYYLSPLEACLRLVTPPLARGSDRELTAAAMGWAFKSKTPDEQVSLTRKQQTLLHAIPKEGVPASAACERSSVGKAVLSTLVSKGLVRLGAAPDDRKDELVHTGGRGAPPKDGAGALVKLSKEQQQAVDRLCEDYEREGFAKRQLWGVTGSGKTEVYLRLAERAVSQGGGVILLVPEIALTPQMIERVKQRFGGMVGVLHSGLTPAQRRREYARISRGETRVVVGARSAVFAPVANLQLVIVDESHDTSYKQEEAPGYHVATVAEFRLEASGGLLLEGSASPAVESMAKPESCVRLHKRVRGVLPDCEVVDMRHQAGAGVLAAATREALAETLRREEQAIVLLNRRGYSAFVHCDSCGHVMMCDDCELSLTYHSQTQRLVCHHCGRSYRQPPVCPECDQGPLTRGGPGTERLADELDKLVPGDRVYRLDSDVTTSGVRVRDILSSFSESHPAVLVGTQMVAKGHDFPDVTLVVVADADTALYVPDFRASERTFQLLTQVSGRAGRAERPGRVVVQTWNPDVPCIRMALERDEQGFYSRELGIRERLGYPPFTRLIRLVTVGEKPERVQRGAEHLVERLSPHFAAQDLRGPARLPTLRGKSRWHIVVASEDAERARAIVSQALVQLKEPYRRRGVGLLVDVDPSTFF
jgi:primosomal protein N' (replication factor Y)